jgi:ssDNA-binding Zn-finger/Zn-ribbon topoisomerase 1
LKFYGCSGVVQWRRNTINTVFFIIPITYKDNKFKTFGKCNNCIDTLDYFENSVYVNYMKCLMVLHKHLRALDPPQSLLLEKDKQGRSSAL